MAKRKTTKAMKSIIIVFFILIILIAVVGLAVSIKDKTEVSVSTFSLSVNGDITSTDKSGYIASAENPLSVEVMFPASVAVEDMVYSYGLQPSKDNDFKFYVDFRVYSFSEWKIEIDKCFDVTPTQKGFVVTPKSNSIQELLSLCYPSSEIRIDDSKIDNSKDLFLLTVKPKTGNPITIGFTLSMGNNVASIELDKTEIVF